MSTLDASERACDNGAASGRRFPWLPVLAAVAFTATAFMLVRKFQSTGEVVSLQDTMDQCDRAAALLEQRMSSNGGVYAG
jgi:hypothetical protein